MSPNSTQCVLIILYQEVDDNNIQTRLALRNTHYHHCTATKTIQTWCLMTLQIERTLFEDTVKSLNNYYAEAEKIGGQSYLEGCLACATAYLIFLCMETRYEKVLPMISVHLNSDLHVRDTSSVLVLPPYCAQGVEESSQVHSGAEREDLCSPRFAHH